LYDKFFGLFRGLVASTLNNRHLVYFIKILTRGFYTLPEKILILIKLETKCGKFITYIKEESSRGRPPDLTHQ
jgi:hypothetical protein